MDAAHANAPMALGLGDVPDEPEAPPEPGRAPAVDHLDPTPVDGARSTAELHELVEVGTDRLEVRPGPGRARLVRTFGAVAGTLVGLGALHAALADRPDRFAVAFLVALGAVSGLFSWLTPHAFKPVAIDGRARRFVRSAGQMPVVRPYAERTSLDEVVAVQVLQVRVEKARAGIDEHRHRRTYDMWQVNLALDGGRRTNVMMHADAYRATASAARVGRLIGVGVVDQSAVLD